MECFLQLRRAGFIVLLLIYIGLWIWALFNHRDRVKTTMPNVFLSDDSFQDINNVIMHGNYTTSSYCRLKWDNLGHVDIDMSEDPPMQQIIDMHPEVLNGGEWSPKNCKSMQKIAIIIPYRNRYHHLKLFLKRLHNMLQLQSISYRIFVVEQAGETPFNRALLFNLGFVESSQFGKYDCYIFHDVDLLPENNKNIYMCDNHIRHLASAIDEMRYHVIYSNSVGGVAALSRDNMIRINGYANSYWGWGKEDDDLSARTMAAGLLLTRPPEYIGRYKMIRHGKSGGGESGNNYFLSWRGRWKKDGLNSLADIDYELISTKTEKLYTNVTIIIRHKNPQIQSVTKESLFWFLSFYFP